MFQLTRRMSVLLLTLVATAARAQVPESTTSFNLERFEMLPGLNLNLLNVGTSEVLPHLQPSFDLFFHYVDDPLVVRSTADETIVQSRLVDEQFKAELSLALGLFDFFSFGLVMPVSLSSTGADLAIAGRPGETVAGVAPGDLRIVPKFRILNPQDFSGFGLHLTATVLLPTGDPERFATDDSVRFRPTLGVDWQHRSGFTVAANIGYELRPERGVHNYISDDVVTWGVGLEVPLFVEELSLMGTLYGSVQTADNLEPFALEENVSLVDTSRSHDPMELLGALRLRFHPSWTILAGAGAGLNEDVGAPALRAFLAIGYAPRSTDRDEDGILDVSDRCPDQPEDKDGYRDEDGCPDPDNDGDGVLDLVDGARDFIGFGDCRNNPEDKDGFQDPDGCPDPDNDDDGLLDVADGRVDTSGFGVCRDNPEDKDGFQDDDGCADPDNDNDKVLDLVDGVRELDGFGACRNIAEDRDGFEDADGCPDPDNDNDGLFDVADKCPDRPENLNNFEDEDGCPDSGSKDVKITETQLVILKKVFFAYDRDVIKPESFDLLNQVAVVLNENPWITKVRVDGHTDRDGPDAYNLDLSQRRVNSVRTYLLKKSIGAERLEAKGFGESVPLEPNTTPKGRAANRRVEFTILEVNGRPIGNAVAPGTEIKSEENRPDTTE